MSSNELIDIHVLEETASRVSGLTRSIVKQITVVEDASLTAQKALSPASRQNRNLGQFRDNTASVLRVYEQIESATKSVLELEEPISQGPFKQGWPTYISIVTKAQNLSSDLSLSPDLRRFPQLPNAAGQQFRHGMEKLFEYLQQLAKSVFMPIDGARFLGSSEQMPQFAPEELSNLTKLVHALESIPGVSRDSVEEVIIKCMENFISESAKPALKKALPVPENSYVHSYRLLCEDVKAVLVNGLMLIYGSSPQRQQKFQGIANQITQRQIDLLHQKNSAEKSPRKTFETSGINAPSTGMSEKANQDGVPDANSASADGTRNSKSLKKDSSQAVGVPGDIQRSSKGTQGNMVPTPPPLHINTAVPQSSGPNSASASGKMNSPANSSSTGIGSTTSGTGGSTGWASFELIEHARASQMMPEELAKHKGDALGVLIQVFSDIEIQSRKSPITSEFGVSGASLQFIKTLQNVCSAGHGVEIILSEVPTRAYLSKPLAPWAAKSEPGPAARANPVSLYFSDIILCLYSILHQIASEQLKDTAKTGIFMLSNLSAIEHYITNSNTDTIITLPKKTEIMDSMGEIALQKFQQLMEQSFREYLSDWSRLAPHLMESTVTGTNISNTKLIGKDRDVVKEKFRVFNAEFESLVEKQKKYQVSDPVLRTRMSQEVKKLIGPLYTRFYLKHKDGDFTKNIAKYVKYTPQQVEEAVVF